MSIRSLAVLDPLHRIQQRVSQPPDSRSAAAKDRVLRPAQVRGANRAAILQTLRQHERLSRAELSRRTGLSEGSVSRIAAELISMGLIVEDGEESSTGGRPATRLSLDPNRLALGVDVRNWEVRFSIATLRGQLIETQSFPTPPTPDATLALIETHFEDCRSRFGRDRIEGIGVSARGIVNGRTGVVELGNDPQWVRVPVQHRLQASLRVPVYVENNVRLGALAEYSYGRADWDGSACLLFVKVDEGVGMGIVFDGKVYSGQRMAAGEFGQMVIADTGDDRRHNRAGCLERLASHSALCARYASLRGVEYMPRPSATSAMVRRICHGAMNGDEAAEDALRRTARYLGIGIANAIWGLDADTVVVDAAYHEAWPLVLAVIQAQLPDDRDLVNFSGLKVRTSSVPGEATMVGAATLPFRDVFAGGERVSLRSSSQSSLQARTQDR